MIYPVDSTIHPSNNWALTLKLVTLMPLLSAQQGQTIHYLSLEDMVASETSVTFVVSKPLKQSKSGSKPTVVGFVAYPDNPNFVLSLL